MNRPREEVARLLEDRLYTKEELFDLVFRIFPEYSANSCEWIIGSLLKSGVIYNVGFGYYRKSSHPFPGFESNAIEKQTFHIAKKVVDESQHCFFSSRQIAEVFGISSYISCVILEVEKSLIYPVYSEVREYYGDRAMMDSSAGEEIKPRSIIIKPLASRSPKEKMGALSIEKIIVELLADKLYSRLFSERDIREGIGRVIDVYDVKFTTVMNYAKRRRCEEELLSILKEYLPENLQEILPR